MGQRVLPNILFTVLSAVIPAVFPVFSPETICCAQTAAGEYAGKQITGEQLTADVLQKSLYAKTPEEEAYCVFAAAQRDKGILPNKVLYSAYRYAVQKDKDRRFDYFRYALEKLCKDASIALKQEPETKKTSVLSNIIQFLQIRR